MVCSKCSFKDKNEKIFFERPLCNFCSLFVPDDEILFMEYLNEKVDWRNLETFRKNLDKKGKRYKDGMFKRAKKGIHVTRPPLGYSSQGNDLVLNENASKVHSLFRTFLNKKYSLNFLAKDFGVSTNGLKKILTNRTYLGEVKFDGRIFKANHKPLISPEIFYAVQRKLKEEYLKPKKFN